MNYQRTREGNRLQLSVPLNFGPDGAGESPHTVKATPRALGQRLSERLWGLWLGNLALRHRNVEGQLQKQEIAQHLFPLVAQNGRPGRWESLFMTFLPGDPHAAMIYALALSDKAEDGWIGTIITMPWIAETLHGLSGFRQAVPFFTDGTGRYVIFPAGRSLQEGPQSLGQEALAARAPGLAGIEADMLAGNRNIVQLRPLLGGDVTTWKLPWSGPTTLADHPMQIKSWHLGSASRTNCGWRGAFRNPCCPPPFRALTGWMWTPTST